MQRYIDRHLVDGVFLQMNFQTGAVRRLHPKSAHPTILHLGRVFVLCSDFRDQDGKSVNVDFYLARNGDSRVVFQTVVDNRKPLERLVQQGKATVAR